MAANANLPLSVILGAVDKFSAPFARVAGKLDAFAAKAGRVGKALTVGVTLPTSAFLGLALRTGAEFEKAMGQVSAATGKPRSDLLELQKVVQKLGESPPFNASQIAAAAAALAKEGKSALEIIGILPSVTALAAANSIDLSEAVEVLADSFDAFNLQGEDSVTIVDKLTVAASKSGGLENLVASLDAVSPSAQAVNASLDDTLTMLVALNATGSEGSKAARALASAYAKMAEHGVNAKDTPLVQMLGEIVDKGGDATKFIEMFGAKAGPALAAATAKGSSGLREFRRLLDESGGEASRRAALATDGAGYSFERLGASLTKLQLAISQSGLLEFVGGLVDTVSSLVSTVAETNPELLKLATVVALVAATIGPLILIAGQIATAISAISTVLTLATPLVAAFNAVLAANPFVLIVLGIAALIAAIYLLWKHWDKVFGFLRATFELFTIPIRSFLTMIMNAFPALERIIPDWIKDLIHGKTFRAIGAGPEVGAAKIAGAAGAGAPQKNETKVAVDFQNVPRGVNVETEKGSRAPVDLSVGYAMAGG